MTCPSSLFPEIMIMPSLLLSRYFKALSNRLEKTWLIFSSSPLHDGSSLIGILILSCNSKKKTEPKTFEEAEMELKDYNEEERIKEFQYLKTNRSLDL